MRVPNVKMNDGREIPQLALGMWRMLIPPSTKKAVKIALDTGYTHFDTAQWYHNEQHLGSAIQQSGINREDLFITTKIKNDNQYWDDLIPSVEGSLKKLKTDYVDLLLIHFPVTETRGPAWRLMEQLHADGRAKSIGVSNYTIRHLEELLKTCKVKPAVNQVELHVYLQQPELVKFCKKHDIVIEAYSPLAHGQRGREDPILQSLAKKHGKSVAQIMIRWCIEIGAVPLPKSTHKARIGENLDVFDFKLDSNDMKQITKLDEDFRTCWDPTNVP